MGRRPLLRSGTVWVRTTVAATLLVALALAAGGAILVSVLTSSLEHNCQSIAITQAVSIADLATSGHLPPVLASPNEDATLFQVVNQNNRVLAASATIAGGAPVARYAALGDRTVVHRVQTLPGTDGGRRCSSPSAAIWAIAR